MIQIKNETLLIVAAILITLFGGCECGRCEDNRMALIGKWKFLEVTDASLGYGHCFDSHVIGFAAGGNPCIVTITGLDGWGEENLSSAVTATVSSSKGDHSFTIDDGQGIRLETMRGCSSWPRVGVNGKGNREGNLLKMELSFVADSSINNYQSGNMHYIYQLQ